MRVSVVICTYAPDLYDDFLEAVESVLAQTYSDVEIVVVVDGTVSVCEKARNDLDDNPDVKVHCNDENRGLSVSRNHGAERATGEVLAFMDDDAVADEEWIAELVGAYEEQAALAVGGRMDPLWVAGKPSFLPEEFYWLIGVTHRGFADGPGEVRNTFGSNISFRRDVFDELGGFDPGFGLEAGRTRNLQSEETELAARLADRYGHGVYYVPSARVLHKVFDYRTDPQWLFGRAFRQGYSKRGLEVMLPNAIETEGAFLKDLLTEFLPQRIRQLPRTRLRGVQQLVMLIALTVAVGIGYAYGTVHYR